ncbi:hypothetical protein FRB97_006535 [Tulasnella sp. 331]|nr:hypothetical protein FRB97_006535 [Tulasnella sp. 331]
MSTVSTQRWMENLSKLGLPMGCDILQFWDKYADVYPIFFKIAMDYPPIQASAPELMEALQMLKFSLCKGRLNFTDESAQLDGTLDEAYKILTSDDVEM